MYATGPALASTPPGAPMLGASPPRPFKSAWGRAGGPQQQPRSDITPPAAQKTGAGSATSPWGGVPPAVSPLVRTSPPAATAATPEPMVRCCAPCIAVGGCGEGCLVEMSGPKGENVEKLCVDDKGPARGIASPCFGCMTIIAAPSCTGELHNSLDTCSQSCLDSTVGMQASKQPCQSPNHVLLLSPGTG
jgi:hypothetical protein